MSTEKAYQYAPDYAVSPGDILEETLDACGMKKCDLAMRCGLTPKTVSLIVRGEAPVTPETALHLERVLGVSAQIWSNLEASYRLQEARQKEEERLTKMTEWIRNFPLSDLRKRRIVSGRRVTSSTVSEVLDFLGLASEGAWADYLEQLQLAARRTDAFTSSPYAVACWLRLAELQVESRPCQPYDRKGFREVLETLAAMTSCAPSEIGPQIVDRCAENGVAVAFVGELKGTHIAGATRWLDTDRALLALSLRHKSDDHFWFSFFHEAAHILLHGKRQFFLDEDDAKLTKQEEEANRFAAEILIPGKAWRAFVREGDFAKKTIRAFARDQGVAPGIVVGRLQKEGHIDWARHNDLKRRLTLKEGV